MAQGKFTANTPSRAICSVVTRHYLPGLIVLYTSILQFQEIPLYLLVVDSEPEETDELTATVGSFLPETARRGLHIIAPSEIYGQSIRQMRYYYNAFELSTACKGGILSWMQRTTTIDRWLYLDSDMLCFGTLEPFFTALDTSRILLTPHRTKPGATPLDDIQLLSAGTFNSGVIGVRRSATASSFTDWLCKVLIRYCLDDSSLSPLDRFSQSTVLFVDQVWMNLAPAYFPEVSVMSDRGLNLGHWNAVEGHLARRDGALHMGEDRVTLLHLSGWPEDQPGRLSRHSPLDWSGNSVWIDLHNRYRESLAPLKEHFAVKYRFDTYPDGRDIPRMHRRAYLRHLLDGNPPVDEISHESIAAIAARYEEQRKADSEYYRIISDQEYRIGALRLEAAIHQYRLARHPVAGWLFRLLSDCDSNSAQYLVEELLACDNRTFVTKAYSSLLGRLPDSEGQEHLQRELGKGKKKIALLQIICQSDEFKFNVSQNNSLPDKSAQNT